MRNVTKLFSRSGSGEAIRNHVFADHFAHAQLHQIVESKRSGSASRSSDLRIGSVFRRSRNHLEIRPQIDTRTSIYRAFDASNRLLYVGVSSNWAERWAKHAQRSSFYPAVARVEISWVDSRAEALAIEALAVFKEKPLYNCTTAPVHGERRTNHHHPRKNDKAAKRKADREAKRQAILDFVAAEPVAFSKRQIARGVGGNNAFIHAEIDALTAEGRLIHLENGWVRGAA